MGASSLKKQWIHLDISKYVSRSTDVRGNWKAPLSMATISSDRGGCDSYPVTTTLMDDKLPFSNLAAVLL